MTNAWYQVNGTSKLTGLGKNYNFSPSGVGDSWAMQNNLARLYLREREAAHKDLMKERAYNQQAARFLSTGRQLLQQAMAAGYDPVDYFIEQRRQYQNQDFYKNADPELQKVIDAQWTAAAIQHADGLKNSKNYDKAQRLYDAFGVPGLNENLMKLRRGEPVDSLGGNFVFPRNEDGTVNYNEVELFGQRMSRNKANALIAEANGDLNALYRGFASQALEDRLLGDKKPGVADATKTAAGAGTDADKPKVRPGAAGGGATAASAGGASRVPIENEIGFTEAGNNMFNTSNEGVKYGFEDRDPYTGGWLSSQISNLFSSPGNTDSEFQDPYTGGWLSSQLGAIGDWFKSPGNPDVPFDDPVARANANSSWKDPATGETIYYNNVKSYSDDVNGSPTERLGQALAPVGDAVSSAVSGALSPAGVAPAEDTGMGVQLNKAQNALKAVQNAMPSSSVGKTSAKATSNAYNQFGQQVAGTARSLANSVGNTVGNLNSYVSSRMPSASSVPVIKGAPSNALAQRIMSPAGVAPVEDTSMGIDPSVIQGALSPAGVSPAEDTAMGVDLNAAAGAASGAADVAGQGKDWLQGVFDEATPSSRINSAMVYAQQYQNIMQRAAQAQAAGIDFSALVQAASQLRDKVSGMAAKYPEVANAIKGSQILLDSARLQRIRELETTYGHIGRLAAGKTGLDAENAKALQEQFKAILGEEAGNAALLMPSNKLRAIYGK